MPNLHPIINDTRGSVWCGPGAISAITGKPLSQVKEAIYQGRGFRRVTGMSEIEARDVLKRLGMNPLRAHVFPIKGRPTLARWLRERPQHEMRQVYLVTLTTHLAAVQGAKYVDNNTMRPIPIGRAPFRRARVLSVRPIGGSMTGLGINRWGMVAILSGISWGISFFLGNLN